MVEVRVRRRFTGLRVGALAGRPRGIPSSGCRDPDLVRDAGDAVKARHVVERGVALELEARVALEGDPAVLDLDVDELGGNLRVPHEDLKRSAADLCVRPLIVVQQTDLNLVCDVVYAGDQAGVLHGRAPLAEAADGAPQGQLAVVG